MSTQPTRLHSPDDLFTRGTRAPLRRTGTRIPLTPVTRQLIYRRDDRTCQLCGTRHFEEALHIDHIRPWSSFEPSDPACDRTDNLRTLCAPCNRDRSNYVRADRDQPATPIVRICLACLIGVEPRLEPWAELPDRFDVYCANHHHTGYAIPGWHIM